MGVPPMQALMVERVSGVFSLTLLLAAGRIKR